MRSSIAFCLLSICVQLTLHVCDTICGKNQYTMLRSNGSVKGCLNCDSCHPGYGLSPVCGSHIKFPPENIVCNPCPSGTFSDTYDSAPCQNCQECVAHELVASNCTKSSDRNCSGTCTKGYYFAKKAPHNCQQCSYCCNDGNDEIQPECVNQGLNATDQHCSQRPDKKCGPEPTPITTPSPIHNVTTPARHHGQPTNHGHSNFITTMVLGLLVGLLLVALVVGAVLYKRRKVHATRDGRHGETAEYQTPGNQVDLYYSQGQQEVAQTPRLQSLQNPGFPSNSNPVTPQASPGGTPCQTDDELEALPDVVTERNKRFMKRQNSKTDALSDKAGENLLDPKGQTSADRKGSFHGENVEGQDIKGADGLHGQRRRSSSGSLSTLKRKLSNPFQKDTVYQPLAGEDPDEVQESLRIVQHPTKQEHQEGSRVVFECKAQGQKNVSYQWLKEGMKIQGKTSCTLVLDSVKVCDFGWYSCEVRCGDGQSECVDPTELDVSPRDGMRFKYLNEAFQQSLDTQQNVEKLLEKEIPGGGGWKQVAFKWDMDNLTIDSLERSHEGGKGVISYLKARYPELTVYEFCKTLKKPNIKRFDIIKELEVHLVSVPQKQTA